jgi:hypothetical protein
MHPTRQTLEATILVLKRLRQESPAFQADALWKLGDFLSAAIDEERALDPDALYQALLKYHRQIGALVAQNQEI